MIPPKAFLYFPSCNLNIIKRKKEKRGKEKKLTGISSKLMNHTMTFRKKIFALSIKDSRNIKYSPIHGLIRLISSDITRLIGSRLPKLVSPSNRLAIGDKIISRSK